MKQRLAHALHFRLLPALLRCWPRPIWRLPAALLATGRALLDRRTRQLAGDALRALDRPDTRLARWRFCWLIAYHTETNLLLGMQGDRLSDAWAGQHVVCPALPPRGGAVITTVHHANTRAGALRFSGSIGPLGALVAQNFGLDESPGADPRSLSSVMVPYSRAAANLRARTFGANIFRGSGGVRAALRFLRGDGYLIIQPDPMRGDKERRPVLGRAFPLAPGTAWFARQSGKPLVPYMVIPTWHGWRIWVGEPIVPTMECVATAMEDCIRAAPTTWHPDYWRAWYESPPWSEYSASDRATNVPPRGAARGMTADGDAVPQGAQRS